MVSSIVDMFVEKRFASNSSVLLATGQVTATFASAPHKSKTHAREVAVTSTR